jgi:hypothetical protein
MWKMWGDWVTNGRRRRRRRRRRRTMMNLPVSCRVTGAWAS